MAQPSILPVPSGVEGSLPKGPRLWMGVRLAAGLGAAAGALLDSAAGAPNQERGGGRRFSAICWRPRERRRMQGVTPAACLSSAICPLSSDPGGVSEWLKEAVLKTADRAIGPGVRIPPPPPAASERALEQWNRGDGRAPAFYCSSGQLIERDDTGADGHQLCVSLCVAVRLCTLGRLCYGIHYRGRAEEDCIVGEICS